MRVLVAIVLCASSCAHVVKIESDPPGAVVVEEGRPIGTTPLLLEETSGAATSRTLEVQKDGSAQRFALAKEAWAIEPLVAGVVAGGALVVGGAGLGVGAGLLAGTGLAAAAVDGDGGAALWALAGAAAMAGVGAAAISIAPGAPFVAAAWFARKSPDVVRVDLRKRKVTTSPPGLAEPLYGRSELLEEATTGPRTAPPR